jgi:hypothetical protein
VDATPVVTTNWFAAVGYKLKLPGYKLKPLRYEVKPEGFALEGKVYTFIQKFGSMGYAQYV